jgi:hypothetical protein
MAEQKTEKKEEIPETTTPKKGQVRKLVILTDGTNFSIEQNETTVSPLEAEIICRKFLGI